jgi:SprT protein
MEQNDELKIFQRYVPQSTIQYCHSLWSQLNFNFKITKERSSKLGDYRFDPMNSKHTISVNHNLNNFSFLITYIHEVAHLMTREKYKHSVLPHGHQWKLEFKKLMLPLLNDQVFPDDILRVLAKHMKNPKASSTSDKHLFMTLRKYDQEMNLIFLSDLDLGTKFLLNKKVYQKIEKRRTRSICIEVSSHRKYLIAETATVKIFEN